MTERVTISDVVSWAEALAPAVLQESYDNAGLQTGDPLQEVTAALITLDVTEPVVDEAIGQGANLIIAHHPVIFGGIKKLTGTSPVERILLKAIRNNIAILAVHTNIDNVAGGVNSMIARKLDLQNCSILRAQRGRLRKLVTFVPPAYLEKIRTAVFSAGAGNIGNYDQCGFTTPGKGSFRGNDKSHPFTGEHGKPHEEPEVRFETIFPAWLEKQVVDALLQSHPYEEVAYDIYSLENIHPLTGSGITGELPRPVDELQFLETLKEVFRIPVIRHSPLLGKPVGKIAVCGGAGSFLLKDAIASGSRFFITGDIKYHQFFEPDGKIVMADIGHYESEQFTKELLLDLLIKKFHTFAVRLSEVDTNPVNYHM